MPHPKTYLIYRHGAHPDNQPDRETCPIAIVTAPSPADAQILAMQVAGVLESQSLSAVPEEDADPEDWILVSPQAVID